MTTPDATLTNLEIAAALPEVSPYLAKPVRSFEEAWHEIAEERAKTANTEGEQL